MCVIFRKLFFLITVLIFLEKTFIHSAVDQDFLKKIHLEKDKDLVSYWKWVTSKHKERLLGNNPVVAVLTKSLSIASAIFTIWIFAETRDKPAYDKQVTSEQFEDLNGHLEYLNVQMEDVQRSLMQLTCLFDTVHAEAKNKLVSRECLQFIQKNRQDENYYATVLAKPSHFITNNHIENKNSLSTSLWWPPTKN